MSYRSHNSEVIPSNCLVFVLEKYCHKPVGHFEKVIVKS